MKHLIFFCFGCGVIRWVSENLKRKLPMIFQAAANWPKKESQDMEKLLSIAWLTRIAAWMTMTMYFDATYPPPLVPPVLRRIITWMSWANEKSTLVVTAHCKKINKKF